MKMKEWQAIALVVGVLIVAVVIDVAMVVLKGTILLDVAKVVVS